MYIIRPKTKEELFNLRHASLQNVIERIFGVLKRRFRILLLAPEYKMDIQNRLPAALSALHNFIRTHDPDDETEIQEIDMDNDDDSNSDGDEDIIPGPVVDAAEDGDEDIIPGPVVDPAEAAAVEVGPGGRTSRNQAIALRNRIASELWEQYQGVLHDREGNESDDDDAMDTGEDGDSE